MTSKRTLKSIVDECLQSFVEWSLIVTLPYGVDPTEFNNVPTSAIVHFKRDGMSTNDRLLIYDYSSVICRRCARLPEGVEWELTNGSRGGNAYVDLGWSMLRLV